MFIARWKNFALFSLLLIPVIHTPGQDLSQLDQQIQKKQSQLERLRNDIQQVQKRIAEKEQAEVDALNSLFNIEEHISLTNRLISALEREVGTLNRDIRQAERQIAGGEAEIESLREKLATRFVHIYKQRRSSMLELVLTSKNWNQATYRSKYLKAATDYDRYLTALLKKEIRRLRLRREQLASNRSRKRQLLQEKESEEGGLRSRQTDRRRQIEGIKRDRRNDEKLLVQKKQAAVEVERIITGLEFDRGKRARVLAEMRSKRELAEVADISFYKGKLPWPTQGRITARFGRTRNLTLNTVTDNPGIDIASRQGTRIFSVLDGYVTTVTYLRGYGTMIIIDHGKDLYTVYAHVYDVEVTEGRYVDQGELLAKVGSNGSLDGAKLHFEVWANRQKQDPEEWLTRPLSSR